MIDQKVIKMSLITIEIVTVKMKMIVMIIVINNNNNDDLTNNCTYKYGEITVIIYIIRTYHHHYQSC